MPKLLPTLSAGGSLALAVVLAQEPLVPATVSTTTSLRAITMLDAEDGVLTARGFDYRATIDARGLHYTPALGTAAATTQHLRLELVDVRRGDAVAVTVAADRPSPQRQGARRVTIPHGDLTERFDVTPDGIELSLEFAQPLAGTGDLVARYRVDTTLTEAPRIDDSLSFLLAGVGGVRIGGVTGIDAHGERATGALRLADGLLELRLPAAFVEHAAWPLVLDPLVGTQFLATTGEAAQADVAHDGALDRNFVVWRRALSGVAMEIRGALLESTTGVIVASAPWLAEPTVAHLAQQSAFVVGWLEAPSLLAPADLKCRSVNSITGATSSTVQVQQDVVAADVAGDNTNSGNAALFVLARNDSAGNAELQLARFTVTGFGAPPVAAGYTTVDAPAGSTIGAVAISKSAPSTSPYTMVWTRVTGNSVEMVARNCTRAGALLDVPIGLDYNTGFEGAGNVDVDSNGTDIVFVADYRENSPGGHRDVYPWAATWDGSQLHVHGYFSTFVRPGTDEMQPAIAWCRDKFVFLWAQQLLPGTLAYDLRGAEITPRCQPCGQQFTLQGVNTTATRTLEFAPAVASRAGAGVDSDAALLVFSEADDGPPFGSNVVVSRYRALGPGGAITLHGTACGNAGTIGTSGPAALGNTGFRITLSGAPPTAVPFLSWSLPGGELACGSCSLSNTLDAVFTLPSGGTASVAFPLPCSHVPFLGVTLQTQWLLLNTGVNPCPSFGSIGLSATPRQRFTLGY